MGWLSKIFKGSNHKVSEGQYQGILEDDKIWDQPRSSVDIQSQDENEELDHAIALSLLEEDKQKSAKEIEDGSHVEEDEALARALQASLDMEPSPRADDHISHYQPFHFLQGFRRYDFMANSVSPLGGSVSAPAPGDSPIKQLISVKENSTNKFTRIPMVRRICAGCHNEIGRGRFLGCMGAVWHPECFRCHSCNQPISEYEFSMSGNQPYHKSCYRELYHPKCDVCKQFIPTNMVGLIEFRAHPFWHQKYCPSHELDNTPRCCSCERMEPRDTQYISLDDGRKLCLECLDSAIMDSGECQPLYLEIRDFYEGLNMKVEQQIPLLLVERQALNEALEGEKHGHHHLPETRGLCLSEEQTVRSIMGKPKMAGNSIIDMITEPYTLIRKCEVTAILILYGLPRLLTGSILAHEMMHAWLRLNGYRTLNQDVEEGICQVLAHMWLESETMSGSASNSASTSSGASSSSSSTSSKKGIKSQFERHLGEFFVHQIESDSSPAYGDGFRAGNRAVAQYGLRRTLDHIRLTGMFPC